MLKRCQTVPVPNASLRISDHFLASEKDLIKSRGSYVHSFGRVLRLHSNPTRVSSAVIHTAVVAAAGPRGSKRTIVANPMLHTLSLIKNCSALALLWSANHRVEFGMMGGRGVVFGLMGGRAAP